MIISFLNQKGGVGKTTLSIQTAYGLQDKGNTVLLVDSDPQGSVRDWHAASEGSVLKVIGLDRETIFKDIDNFRSQYDFIIIDGAPQLSLMAAATLKCSDLVIIPVQPSPWDIWAAEEIIRLAKSRRHITDDKLKIALAINRCIGNTHLSREIKEALEAYEVPILGSMIYQRVAYAESAKNGSTVIKDDPNSKASLEIKNMVEEILGL